MIHSVKSHEHSSAMFFLLSTAVDMDYINSKAACTVGIHDLKPYSQFDDISIEIKNGSSPKLNNFYSILENCDRSENGRYIEKANLFPLLNNGITLAVFIPLGIYQKRMKDLIYEQVV